MIPERLREPRHLGDGVYVRFDGYHVVVAVNHHLNEVVCLDPGVQVRFVEFIEEIAALGKTE